MNIKWEKRKNEYFAYIRESRRVEGKTKTMNRYLGNSLSIAFENLNKFFEENNVPSVERDILAQRLTSEGKLLGVRELVLPIIMDECQNPDDLDKLAAIIQANGQISKDYYENRRKFDAIKDALLPVRKERAKALYFPEIKIKDLKNGTTVKIFNADLRAEILLHEAIELQSKLMNAMVNHSNY